VLLFGDDTLGLFDDDTGIQRSLQVSGDVGLLP